MRGDDGAISVSPTVLGSSADVSAGLAAIVAVDAYGQIETTPGQGGRTVIESACQSILIDKRARR